MTVNLTILKCLTSLISPHSISFHVQTMAASTTGDQEKGLVNWEQLPEMSKKVFSFQVRSAVTMAIAAIPHQKKQQHQQQQQQQKRVTVRKQKNSLFKIKKGVVNIINGRSRSNSHALIPRFLSIISFHIHDERRWRTGTNFRSPLSLRAQIMRSGSRAKPRSLEARPCPTIRHFNLTIKSETYVFPNRGCCEEAALEGTAKISSNGINEKNTRMLVEAEPEGPPLSNEHAPNHIIDNTHLNSGQKKVVY